MDVLSHPVCINSPMLLSWLVQCVVPLKPVSWLVELWIDANIKFSDAGRLFNWNLATWSGLWQTEIVKVFMNYITKKLVIPLPSFMFSVPLSAHLQHWRVTIFYIRVLFYQFKYKDKIIISTVVWVIKIELPICEWHIVAKVKKSSKEYLRSKVNPKRRRS